MFATGWKPSRLATHEAGHAVAGVVLGWRAPEMLVGVAAGVGFTNFAEQYAAHRSAAGARTLGTVLAGGEAAAALAGLTNPAEGTAGDRERHYHAALSCHEHGGGLMLWAESLAEAKRLLRQPAAWRAVLQLAEAADRRCRLSAAEVESVVRPHLRPIGNNEMIPAAVFTPTRGPTP